MSTRALLVVDVQNDFCEGGSLAVLGGADVALEITKWIAEHRDDYRIVVASKDFHIADSDNGKHFAAGEPDYENTWPVHCVAHEIGSDFHPNLDIDRIDEIVYKGQGKPAYSAFEGLRLDDLTLGETLAHYGIDTIDVVGIATDYCVKATAIDAAEAGYSTHLIIDLTVAVTGEQGKAQTARELAQEHDIYVQTRDSLRW